MRYRIYLRNHTPKDFQLCSLFPVKSFLIDKLLGRDMYHSQEKHYLSKELFINNNT